jgi:hypothetical protein
MKRPGIAGVHRRCSLGLAELNGVAATDIAAEQRVLTCWLIRSLVVGEVSL